MKIFRMFLNIVLLTVCGTICAQDHVEVEHYTLTMHLKDGNTVGITFNREPTIKMEDGIVKFQSTTSSAEYAAGDIERFTVDKGGVYTLIRLIPIDKGDISWQGDGQNLLLVSGKPGQTVQVTAIDGTVIATQHTGEDGHLQLSFDRYPAGMYIVKTGKVSFKIIRK